MSQMTAPAPTPALPASSVRTPVAVASAREVPEFLFILRHYWWLILLGTILGAVVGTGLFLGYRMYAPRYTIAAKFLVLPPPQTIEARDVNGLPMQNEEIARLINRQRIFIASDQVLNKVVRTDAFQRSQVNWYRDKTILRDELRVVQDGPNSDVFRVELSGRYPEELHDMVQAIADAYYGELRNDTTTDEARRLAELRDAEKRLTEKVKNNATQLENKRTVDNISALTNVTQVKVQTLGSLNVELIRAEADLNGARSYAVSIKKQIETNTLELPAELERFVQDDPTVRYLVNNAIQLRQERVASLDRYAPTHPVIRALDARIAENEKQAQEIQDKLRAQMRLYVQEKADTGVKAAESRVEDLRSRQVALQQELKDLDRKLVEYSNLQAQYQTDQKLLEDLNRRVLLETLKGGLDSTRVRVFAPAETREPGDISFPRFKIFFPVGIVSGLVLTLGLAYLLELANTRVRTPRDITRSMELPLLGFVPHQDDDRFIDGELGTTIRTAPASMIAESFRLIRGRIGAIADGKSIRTLLVASISPGGGATTVANNLATGLALNGQRVLLVDANFYRPGLRLFYQNTPTTGLGDVLADPSVLEQAIVTANDVPGLSVMGPGAKAATRSSELLGGKSFNQLLGILKDRYDVVVFDGAPLSLVSDSVYVASKVDGVVAVVRAGVVSRGTVGRIRDQLRQVHANLLGIVLNAAQTRGAGYFKQTYQTYYRYAEPARNAAAAAR